MATEQDFLAFGIGAGANVIDQATYKAAQAAGFVAVGFAAGLAQSAQLNKVWRQSSVMSYVMGQFIFDLLNQDVLDNDDTDTLLSQFKAAVLAQAGGSSTPLVVTASVNIVLTSQQRSVALRRTVAPAAMSITMPDIGLGESVSIADVFGNCSIAKVTLLPSSGTINGAANYVMNEDFQNAKVTRYSATVWGVAS